MRDRHDLNDVIDRVVHDRERKPAQHKSPDLVASVAAG
jgi:hypothetical protein